MIRHTTVALVVAVLASASVASASALRGVAAARLSAGSAPVTACDTDGLSTAYTTVAGKVTSVTVGGIADPACEGAALSLTLVGAEATSVGAVAAGLPVDSHHLTVVGRAETVPPTTCRLTAAADTFTDEGSADSNYGGAPELRVASRTGQARRTFLRFDLGPCAIPSQAVVVTADLHLALGTPPAESRTYDAYRLTGSWDEATLTWNSAQPTAAGTPTSSVSTGTTADVTLQWDVTGDVQAHVATPASNHGWVVRDATETASRLQESVLRSREHATTAERPTLVIGYHP